MDRRFKYIDNEAVYKTFKEFYGQTPDISNTISVVEKGDVVYLRFKIFEDLDYITQGFSTRLGGVSEGIYSSMNLTYSKDDNKNNVLKNFHIIGDALGISPQNMVYSKQTHTTNVIRVDSNYRGLGVVKEHEYDDIDGLITDESDVCLVTAYADCIPVIVVDTKNRSIGAAHAGWRGTTGNIVNNMLKLMNAEWGTKPADIKAFVGPGICEHCYEVSEDVADEFKQSYKQEELQLILKEGRERGKYQLNLPMANVINLYNSGVSMNNIAVADICTCCNPDRLFSHRATKGQRGILCNFINIK